MTSPPTGDSWSSAHRLTASHLRLTYGGRTVIEDLSLDIPPHTMGSIIGPNGCGKSTFLKALARILKPASGTVMLDGEPITSMPTRKVATILGLLPQNPSAPAGITIADLVARGRYPHHHFVERWTAKDEKAVERALALTGLTDMAGCPIDRLSGGQRQRAWIALTLAQQTDILLLDEPTTYLDIAYQLEVLDLLSTLNRQEGVTVVMVLHDLNMAARYSDWILAIKDGRRVALGAPDKVITESLVSEVFDIASTVVTDGSTGTPLMTPAPSHSLEAHSGGAGNVHVHWDDPTGRQQPIQ